MTDYPSLPMDLPCEITPGTDYLRVRQDTDPATSAIRDPWLVFEAHDRDSEALVYVGKEEAVRLALAILRWAS